jgi:hypothetical protein
MKAAHVAAVLALGAALAACDRGPAPPHDGRHTAVVGAAGVPADARGEPLPTLPLPAHTQAQVARTGSDSAVAVWLQDGHVFATAYARDSGWGPSHPLETIYGQASEPQLAANGRGVALAVWRHTVGGIESLRFSTFQAGRGWSAPDVVPGALPRSDGADGAATLQLRMDDQGNAVARWPSGFDANAMQVARYAPGQGWSRAIDTPLPAQPPASASSATQ